MNKQKTLEKKIVKLAVMGLLALLVFGGIYGGSVVASNAVTAMKLEAERRLSDETTRLNGLRTQMEKSGQAEKQYAELMAFRVNQEFSMNQEMLYAWLRSAATQFRLTSFKLTRATEEDSLKPELAQLNYRISLRAPVKLEFAAISDMHVFSFIEALRRSAPGFVVIEKIEFSRKSDLKPDLLTNLRNGGTPPLVDAKIDFIWVGVVAKPEPSLTTPASPVTQGGAR